MAIRLLNTTPQRVSWLLWAQPGPACRRGCSVCSISSPSLDQTGRRCCLSRPWSSWSGWRPLSRRRNRPSSHAFLTPNAPLRAMVTAHAASGGRIRAGVEPACASARPSGNREIPLAISIGGGGSFIHVACANQRALESGVLDALAGWIGTVSCGPLPVTSARRDGRPHRVF
jgi:hypothetical protein